MKTASLAEALPPSWYTDRDVLQREQERIFRCSWQYVGRLDELADAPSYFTSRAGDVPIVVTRARDAQLRAFVNVCRHRWSVVVDGAGSRETLQCPYHAWTYGLDGTLRAAPRSDREAGFDRDELGLLRVQVDTWGPFVFVNPDLDAGPLAETLGALPEILARVVDVETLRFHSRMHFEVEANWKIAMENFLECYHCPTAHRDFSRVVDVAPDAYVLEEHEWFSSQYATTRDGGREGQFHMLWPNTTINVFPGPANLSIGPAFPAGTERTERWLDYFWAADVDDAAIAELFELDEIVGREDAELVRNVQRGVRAGLVTGHVLPRSERLIAHFDALVRRALA